MKQPLILCDHAEGRSGVPDKLRERGAIVQMQRLDCGDYLLSAAFAVERKAARDLVDSIISRKLFRQLGQIADTYEYAALLLEGDSWEGDRNLRTPMLGELYHWLSLRSNVTVLYSPSANWTAKLLLDLATREQLRRLPATTTPRSVQRSARSPRDLLLAFPGVGAANADKLLARFGSVRGVVDASRVALEDVVGPTRGRRLHQLFVDA